MVREIAQADYSQDVEEHLEALRPLVRGERTTFAEIACWHPGEVLELTRWSTPAREDRRGHLIRGFSCAALMLDGRGEYGRETLFPLLESTVALGERDVSEAVLRALMARFSEERAFEGPEFGALAIVVLFYRGRLRMDDIEEGALVDWFREIADGVTQRALEEGLWDKKGTWLFVDPVAEINDDKWRAMLKQLRGDFAERPLGQLLRDRLR